MNDRERDKFYKPPDPPDDDAEYELEPPDPDVISAEKRHAKEIAQQVRESIDIDEVYREADRNRGTEIVENWMRNFHYRFHIKHVLIATALLTMVIAVYKLGLLGLTFTILIMGSVGGLYLYLSWQEQKQRTEADQKREAMYAKRRQRMLSRGKTTADDEPLAPVELTPPSVNSSPKEAADMWDESPAPEPMRISFSLRSLMIAITVAAVSLGIICYFAGPGPSATILGLIAFAGLVVYAIGFVPPQSLILGWWFILLLYVLLTIAGAV